MRWWPKFLSTLAALWLVIRHVQDVVGIATLFDDGEKLWEQLVAVSDAIEFMWIDWLLLSMLVAGLALSTRAVVVVRRLSGRFGGGALATHTSQFDTTILDAINYLIGTAPHSYTRSDWSERAAFRELHNEMSTGELRVIGKESDFAAPRRISARECRRLTPIEVGVPRTRAAPDGVRFALTHLVEGREDEGQAALTLSDLRVRSDDLYRIWPRILRQENV